MEKRNVILLLLLLTLAPLTTAYEFCENTTSKSELEIIEIIDQEQADEVTWTWGPAEELNITVSIENKNFSKRDFDIELFLLDENSNIERFSSDISATVKTISLGINQPETLNFLFQLKEGIGGTYSLHARFIDSNNQNICTSLEAAATGDEVTIEIEQEEKIIVIRNINGPTNITAGSQVKYVVEVINLGNIAEDRVLVIAYNNKFSIREEREIINLEIDESKTVTFNFTIPENASLQEELILFSTEYSYQNKTGFYYQFSEKEKIFLIQIQAPKNQTEIQNQTQNQTETILPIEETIEEKSETPYLLITIIIILLIIAIAVIFFFLKYKEEPKVETPSEAPTSAASDYVKNIQKGITPSNSPNKPS
jgi:hypothetical protein